MFSNLSVKIGGCSSSVSLWHCHCGKRGEAFSVGLSLYFLNSGAHKGMPGGWGASDTGEYGFLLHRVEGFAPNKSIEQEIRSAGNKPLSDIKTG